MMNLTDAAANTAKSNKMPTKSGKGVYACVHVCMEMRKIITEIDILFLVPVARLVYIFSPFHRFNSNEHLLISRITHTGTKGPSDVFKIVQMIMERSYQPVIVFSFSKRECEAHALQMSKLDFNTRMCVNLCL